MTGIEEGTQVVSEIELKLAEHQDLPDDLDDLEQEHQELLLIQQTIHDHQVGRSSKLSHYFGAFRFVRCKLGM